MNVPVGGPLFSQDEAEKARLTVPAGTLSEENPGDPTQSGTYKIVVTTFLDSALGAVGYDMMGYAEARSSTSRARCGPSIQVGPPERPGSGTVMLAAPSGQGWADERSHQ